MKTRFLYLITGSSQSVSIYRWEIEAKISVSVSISRFLRLRPLLYVRARERPGLPEWSSSRLGARQFWAQVHLDVERMPKVRRYLKDRRRRPALAAARLRLEKLVALPDAGVANGEAEVEAAVRAVPPSDSTKKWLELLKDNAADPHQTSADWCI